MKISRWITIVLLLVTFRFINLISLYFLNHLEIGDQANAIYRPIGFTTEAGAQKKLGIFHAEMAAADIVHVVSGFDLWNSFVFYIYNPGAMTFVDFGALNVRVEKGFSSIAFSPLEVIRLRDTRNRTLYRYGGISLVSPLIGKQVDRLQAHSVTGLVKGFSYMVRPLEKSRYLYILYMVYFFLPLIIILIAAFTVDLNLLAALFYYAGLFVLFNFKQVMVELPFGWLFRLIGFTPEAVVLTAIAIAFLVVFLFLAIRGITGGLSISEKKIEWRGGFIFFFMALPLFLRF